MANIAVSNGVLEQVLKYQCSQEDKQLAPLIFKRLSCPFLVRQKQLEELQYDAAFIKQLATHNSLLKLIDVDTVLEQVNKTKFKLLLTIGDVEDTDEFTIVDARQPSGLDVAYFETFLSGQDRNKAILHIKALLSDKQNIEIYDPYLVDKFNKVKTILINILHQQAHVFIYSYFKTDNEKQQIASQIRNHVKKIKCFNYDGKNMHDRYIKANNRKGAKDLEVILSSGFEYLADNDKDITYMIKDLSC
jgi:hypothetical protein